MFETGKLVVANDQLNIAVKNALSISKVLETDNRTRIQNNSMMGGDSVAVGRGAEYNSYFKLVNVSEISEEGTVTHKVAVVDGGIFDGTVDTSVKMPWLINGEKTSVNQAVIPITEETTYIYLKNETKEDEEEHTIEVVSDKKEHPDFTSTACYKHIGRVILSDDGMKIIQDFCSGGIPETIWIVSNCNSTVGGV